MHLLHETNTQVVLTSRQLQGLVEEALDVILVLDVCSDRHTGSARGRRRYAGTARGREEERGGEKGLRNGCARCSDEG